MNLIDRLQAPTPKFFRVVRNIGLILTAASATVLAAPLALPAAVLSIAGYVGLAGAVASAVSQATIPPDDEGTTFNGGGAGIPLEVK